MINPGDWLVIGVVFWFMGTCVRAMVWGVALAVARYHWRRDYRRCAWTPREAASHWRVRRVLTELRHVD